MNLFEQSCARLAPSAVL